MSGRGRGEQEGYGRVWEGQGGAGGMWKGVGGAGKGRGGAGKGQGQGRGRGSGRLRRSYGAGGGDWGGMDREQCPCCSWPDRGAGELANAWDFSFSRFLVATRFLHSLECHARWDSPWGVSYWLYCTQCRFKLALEDTFGIPSGLLGGLPLYNLILTIRLP